MAAGPPGGGDDIGHLRAIQYCRGGDGEFAVFVIDAIECPETLGGLADYPFFLGVDDGSHLGFTLMRAPVASAVGTVIPDQMLMLVRDVLE